MGNAGNVKAWHRKADCLTRLNEWDDAIEAAQHGMTLDPSNATFQKMIEKATADKAKDAADKALLKREIVNAYAKMGGQGLQPLVLKALATLVAEYKTK